MFDPKVIQGGKTMTHDDALNITSREVAQEARPEPETITRETVSDHEVDPNVRNADRPKGLDKPDGQLESLNNDLKRVEERTTM